MIHACKVAVDANLTSADLQQVRSLIGAGVVPGVVRGAPAPTCVAFPASYPVPPSRQEHLDVSRLNDLMARRLAEGTGRSPEYFASILARGHDVYLSSDQVGGRSPGAWRGEAW